MSFLLFSWALMSWFPFYSFSRRISSHESITSSGCRSHEDGVGSPCRRSTPEVGLLLFFLPSSSFSSSFSSSLPLEKSADELVLFQLLCTPLNLKFFYINWKLSMAFDRAIKKLKRSPAGISLAPFTSEFFNLAHQHLALIKALPVPNKLAPTGSRVSFRATLGQASMMWMRTQETRIDAQSDLVLGNGL